MKLDPKIVVVGNRVRKDVDHGIRALSQSIELLGQLQPIVIDEQNNLIAGARRLRACLLLEIDVSAVIAENVTDAILKLKAERDENTCRIDFTPEEAVEAGRGIEKLEGQAAKERQRSHGGTAPGKSKNTGGNLPRVNDPTGKTRDKIAEAVGMSGRTYEKAKAVVAAAKADPELRPIVDEMNETGKVDPAYKAVKARKAEAATADTDPPTLPITNDAPPIADDGDNPVEAAIADAVVPFTIKSGQSIQTQISPVIGDLNKALWAIEKVADLLHLDAAANAKFDRTVERIKRVQMDWLGLCRKIADVNSTVNGKPKSTTAIPAAPVPVPKEAGASAAVTVPPDPYDCSLSAERVAAVEKFQREQELDTREMRRQTKKKKRAVASRRNAKLADKTKGKGAA